MVKVVDQSPQDKTKKTLFSRAVVATEDMVTQSGLVAKVSGTSPGIFVYLSEKPEEPIIRSFPGFKEVNVMDKVYEDLAVRLAGRYEALAKECGLDTDREFTVIREY